MNPALSFLKAHWRPIVVVIALVAAYGAGRFGGAKHEEIKASIDLQEHIVYKDRVVEVKTETKAQDKVQVVYVDRVIEKDGTIREKSETRTETATETKKADVKQETATKDETVHESAKTDKIVSTDAPRFTVSLLVGYQFGGHGLLEGSGFNLIPGVGPLALGVSFQYRIAGPFSVGVFGLTTGAVGAQLALTF